MASWAPIIKASLPYIADIITTAIPHFTSKPEASSLDPLATKQIEELQVAATGNAESIKILAERLKQTIVGIEQAATDMEKTLAKLRLVSWLASGIAVTSLMVALWAVSQ